MLKHPVNQKKVTIGMPEMISRVGVRGGAVATYAEVLRDKYNASEIFALVDIASGTDLTAFVNPARTVIDGVHGWDLQNAAGPVAGTLAPYSDGVNDYGDVLSSSLNAIYDVNIGGIGIWLKGDSILNTATRFTAMNYFGNGSNSIIPNKGNAAYRFTTTYESGNDRKTLVWSGGSIPDDWFLWIANWNHTANEITQIITYSGGQNLQTTALTTAPDFSDLTVAIIGVLSATPTSVFKGWMSYHFNKFGSVFTTTDAQGMYNAASTAGPD